ncbi:MAG: hypothetical protein M1826_000538 [Phylliscum demangeonii]|nr:MAG: hypothetical protein M1826_000538 [Phylliscum demangeonii]
MADHPNGPGASRHLDPGQTPTSTHTHPTSHRAPLPYPVEDPVYAMRRIPSYEAGDDAMSTVAEQAPGQAEAVADLFYDARRRGTAGAYASGRGASVPALNEVQLHGSALAGYRHQNPQQILSPGTAPYNPQLFAPVQAAYNGRPPNPTPARPYPATPQPYNPARYGSTTSPSWAGVPPSPSSNLQPKHRNQPLAASQIQQQQQQQQQQQLARMSSTDRPWSQSGQPMGYNAHLGTRQPSHAPFPSPVSPTPAPAPPSASTARSYRPSDYPSPHPNASTSAMRPALTTLSGHQPSSDPGLRMTLDPSPSIAHRNPPTNPLLRAATHPLPLPPTSPPVERTSSGRHPQAKPLPGPPAEAWLDEEECDEDDPMNEGFSQESIWRELEEAVGDPEAGQDATPLSALSERAPRSPLHMASPQPEPLFSRSRDNSPQPQRTPRTNGHLTPVGSERRVKDDADADEDGDDSDAEAAAGLAAMQMADAQDADNYRRRVSGQVPMLGTYPSDPNPHPLPQPRPDGARQPQDDDDDNDYDDDDDDDYANVDIGLYGGGYEGHLSYGNGHLGELDDRALSRTASQTTPLSATESIGRSTSRSFSDQDATYPASHARPAPQVYTFGAGGLTDPTAHRRKMSYDDADEAGWDAYGDRRSANPSPSRVDYPEMFYHPGIRLPGSPDRPLPPIPPIPGSHVAPPRSTLHVQPPSRLPSPMPDALNNQLISANNLAVPRSSSLSSHSSTPQTVPPVRSKTDAEERKARLLKAQHLTVHSTMSAADLTADMLGSDAMALDLPTLPAGKRKRFHPTKLSTADFKRCVEPWALSSVAAWVKELSEDETDLKESTVVHGIVSLFTHKVPTMNVADAETLSMRVVQEMFAADALVRDEEWVKVTSESVTGVMWQLTGSGCYAPRLHVEQLAGRCYSHHCSRTLRKVNLHAQGLEPQRKLEDWATFYQVTKEAVEHVNKKEVERQNILHEVVQTEDQFMDQLNVLLVLYRDQLVAGRPRLIHEDRIAQFASDVFGKVEAIKRANEDFLLAQLKYRQQEQGPWIIGFSDIFREWIRKGKHAYIEYAANFPRASLMIRKEADQNLLFRQFLDDIREHERSKRLGWDTYLKAPITRLQRYTLLLSTILKSTVQETEEKANLRAAIDEIKGVTLECDARVAEMSRKVELMELGDKLLLRPGLGDCQLHLDHLGRELIFEGELQRMGNARFNWLETHAMLFDHYLVLAKPFFQKVGSTNFKHERYDVSKRPILMDLLMLESTNDDPVTKSSVKGIGAVTTVTSRVQPTSDTRHHRALSTQNAAGPPLTSIHTNSSLTSTGSGAGPGAGKSSVSNTALDGSRDEKTLFPFRIKHLGHDVYTLYASSAQSRQDWCDKILEAKTKHAAALFAQNAEPFRLRVIADTAFGYDASGGGGGARGTTVVRGTPLDRAVRQAEQAFEGAGVGPRPGPICRAAVNCATTFLQPYGKVMVAVGTDFGVFIAEADNPRGWRKAIATSRVTQIAVLEEFSLLLLIAERSLVAYHLDVVCPVSGQAPRNDSLTRAPQKLSGNREVGFFATGRMKDRTLVFYKKGGGMSSTFKVLEPVYHKSMEKKPSRFSRRGTTEFFREFDEFYIPAECFGINVFRSYFANATARGFEVLNLDKKQPYAVPDLKAPDVATIAARIGGQKPLGMFRLNENEFLLCYDECAVYANKHGELSRSVVMEYVDKARSAAVFGPYVLLFDADYVEIRNAENGRLRQIVAGRDVRCLDDGQNGGGGGGAAADAGGGGGGGAAGRSIKIALQHPERDRMHLILELVLNDGQRD